MIEPDTIKLLRECDAGVKMGVASIGDVEKYVSDSAFKEMLLRSKHEHETLGLEIDALLREYGDEGKEPNPIAKGMSWIKTNVKLGMEDSDRVVADLLTDGCNMGVKSLRKYLNEYKAAHQDAKDITKRLIQLEEKLADQLKDYL